MIVYNNHKRDWSGPQKAEMYASEQIARVVLILNLVGERTSVKSGLDLVWRPRQVAQGVFSRFAVNALEQGLEVHSPRSRVSQSTRQDALSAATLDASPPRSFNGMVLGRYS